ncbi:hypothetical protein F0562_017628 [Nyssa sinensis]|uniref:Uncharacterized protein n=1 Tax=Nyssa sinensis TaxID=561372 RepID=A0A5J4ZFA1_9ASTE|nr:hypothetical protein F0562_017628 [Nyssa sinensis]
MEVVMALSTIRRAIGAITSSSIAEVAGNVVPDLEILIVKVMEQRWVWDQQWRMKRSSTAWYRGSVDQMVVEIYRKEDFDLVMLWCWVPVWAEDSRYAYILLCFMAMLFMVNVYVVLFSDSTWVLLFCGDLAKNRVTGSSIAWWKWNANAHHIACNGLDFDPDLQHMPLFW